MSSMHEAFSQNLSRKVLYTLKSKEGVKEAKFSFQTDSVKFYCLIEDSSAINNERIKLVFNGRIIEKAEIISKAGDYAPFIDMYNIKESYYSYKKGNKYNLKFKGKEYGPYDDVQVKNTNDPNKYIIVYKQVGQSFIVLPDNRIAGPVNREISNFFIAPESKTYFYTSYKNEKYDGNYNVYYNGKYCTEYNSKHVITNHPYTYFNKKGDCIFSIFDRNIEGINLCINGRRINKNCDYKSCILKESGKYAYVYYKDGKAYLNINNEKEFGGFELTLDPENNHSGISGFDINNKNNFIYRYTKDNKDYVNFNGNIIGEYDNIESFIVGFEDAEFIKTKEWERTGAIPERIYSGVSFLKPSVNEKGDRTYAYRFNSKFYISMNDKREGPYQEVWSPVLDEKGNYIYWCKLDGKQYIVINGEREGPFEKASLPNLNNGNYIYVYQEENRWFVNINGIKEGPYEELDHNNNYQLEGISTLNDKGQYSYSYIENETQYACINGKKYKEPLQMGWFYFKPETTEGFKWEYYTVLNGGYYDNFEKFTIDQNENIIRSEISNNVGSYGSQSFIAKNERDIMQCNGNYPYVIINNKRYGESKPLAAGYNYQLNVFRWASLEENELVVYEYKIR